MHLGVFLTSTLMHHEKIKLKKNLHNPNLKANREKKFTKLSFCQKIYKKKFLTSNFFMQMFNVSILRKQSIRLFHQKLW